MSVMSVSNDQWPANTARHPFLWRNYRYVIRYKSYFNKITYQMSWKVYASCVIIYTLLLLLLHYVHTIVVFTRSIVILHRTTMPRAQLTLSNVPIATWTCLEDLRYIIIISIKLENNKQKKTLVKPMKVKLLILLDMCH